MSVDRDELWSFNRKELILWLETRNQFGEASGGAPDMPPERRYAQRNYDLLDGHQLRLLSSPEAADTDKRIRIALERLRLNFYHLWKTIYEIYLAEDSSGNSALEEWKAAKEGTHNHRKALWHDTALEVMLAGLQGHSERLTVIALPVAGRGEKEQRKLERRVVGCRHFIERLELGATRKEAVNETAARYDVSRATVYRWLEWMRGI